MVFKHYLHCAQDRGGLGFKPAQSAGNSPQGCDTSAEKAKGG